MQQHSSILTLLALAITTTIMTTTEAFLLPLPKATPSSSSVLKMGRDWLTDSLPKIPDEQLAFVHDYLDNKGKNIVRGPAQVKAPDGRIIDVLSGEEVEIIGGLVYRTFLEGFPPVNEARLKQEGQVVLEIRWGDNWETQGFTLEVMGVTGPDCVEYTNRFCEATGCKQLGPMVVKPAYFEVPLVTQTESAVEKLRQVQAGTARIEF